MAKRRISTVQTPGDLDRLVETLTGQRNATRWCAVCGDQVAAQTNGVGDDVCQECNDC